MHRETHRVSDNLSRIATSILIRCFPAFSLRLIFFARLKPLARFSGVAWRSEQDWEVNLMEQVSPKRAVMFAVTACLIGIALGSAVTLAVLNVQRSIPSSGLVVAVNVGVYSDAACTLNLTSIDWGSVYPAGAASHVIYVKDTGNVPMTLNMTAVAWNPPAAVGQIMVAWDREGFVVGAGQSTSATLTLTVSQGISGVTSFSVNIVITGSG
jgi:hypothetical protein